MTFCPCGDFEELSQKSAERFVTLLQDALTKRDTVPIILSAGKTHKRAYEIIADRYRDSVEWSRVVVFHMDEYVPEKENSNDFKMQSALIKENFYNKMPIKHFFSFKEYSPKDYCSLLKRYFPIEIAFQGVGVNGHYGFNEPPTPLESSARYVRLLPETLINNGISATSMKAKTLGLNITRHIRHHIVLIEGAHKEEAYRRLRNTKDFDPNFPISILKLVQNVEIYHTFAKSILNILK
jgi:glucosamine-6-phosphate deaminase